MRTPLRILNKLSGGERAAYYLVWKHLHPTWRNYEEFHMLRKLSTQLEF